MIMFCRWLRMHESMLENRSLQNIIYHKLSCIWNIACVTHCVWQRQGVTSKMLRNLQTSSSCKKTFQFCQILNLLKFLAPHALKLPTKTVQLRTHNTVHCIAPVQKKNKTHSVPCFDRECVLVYETVNNRFFHYWLTSFFIGRTQIAAAMVIYMPQTGFF